MPTRREMDHVYTAPGRYLPICHTRQVSLDPCDLPQPCSLLLYFLADAPLLCVRP